MRKYKVLFADLDDTLITRWSGKTFAQGIWDMKFKFEVWRKIKELEPEYIFIITNQGGLGKFVNENDFIKKLDYVEVSLKDYVKHDKFKGIQSMYCDSVDKGDPFRKPNPGMVKYFLNELSDKGYTKDDCLMIGDASGKEGNFSDSDIKTAENAGIAYLDVDDFLSVTFF